MKLSNSTSMIYKLLQRFLVIFLLVRSSALIRKAQNEFFKIDGNHPLRGIFPFDGANSPSNLKESFDDGNIQKVINILQNNIKQWSFIESQLLEPNVNLGMPEIFIPLKHLTTTLEILGNIFFVQNDFNEAKKCLERACPLMELLPNSLLVNSDNNHNTDKVPVDFIEFDDSLAVISDKTIRKSIMESSKSTKSGLEHHKSYTESCFSLLRDVYSKLYGATLRGRVLNDRDTKRIPTNKAIKNNLGVKQAVAPTSSFSHSINSRSKNGYHENFDATVKEREKQSEKQRIQATLNQELIGFKSAHSNRLASIFTESDDGDWEDGEQTDTTTTAATTIAVERTGADYDTIQQVHSGDMEGKFNDDIIRLDNNNEDQQYMSPVLIGDDIDFGNDGDDDIYFDIEQKLEDLRSPFEHLRLELNEILSGQDTAFDYSIDRESFGSRVDTNDENIFPTSDRVGLGLSSSRKRDFLHDEEVLNTNKLVNSDEKKSSSRFCTSIISEDLEIMLRKFVKEDQKGRKKVLHAARKYYDELDIAFPNMDYNEYAANMDMGQVYLDVMSRVCEEGVDFITEELESWQTEKISSLVSNLDNQPSNNDDEYDKQHQSIVWELNPDTGEQREIIVEFSGNYFNTFSLSERNRLLVLSAFDIVRTAPDDPFNLGLGFNLGILDNDRSHNGEILMDKVLRDAVSSATSSGHLFDHANNKNNNNNEFPNKLSISFDSLYGSNRGESFHSDQHIRKLYSNGFYFNRDALKNDLSSADSISHERKRSNDHNNMNKKKRKANRNIIHDENLVHDEFLQESSSISHGRVNNQASDAIYDDSVTATVGLSAPIRSAVPTLGSDSGWVILTLLALFILLIALSIFVAKQVDSNKKRNNPFRHKGRGNTSKKGSLLGVNIVDFMYAYLYGSSINGSDIDSVTDSSSNNDDNTVKSAIYPFYSFIYFGYNIIVEFLGFLSSYVKSFNIINHKSIVTSATHNKSKRLMDKVVPKSFIAHFFSAVYSWYIQFTSIVTSLITFTNNNSRTSVFNESQNTQMIASSAEVGINSFSEKSEQDLSSKNILSISVVNKNETTPQKSKMLTTNYLKKGTANDTVANSELILSPPLVINHRRVSWVVANEFTDKVDEVFESEWAEAKKKNTKKQEKTQQSSSGPPTVQISSVTSSNNNATKSQTTPLKANQPFQKVIVENTDTSLITTEQHSNHQINQQQQQSVHSTNISVSLNLKKREVSYKNAVKTTAVINKEIEVNVTNDSTVFSGFNSSLTIGKSSMPLYDLSEAKLIAAKMANQNEANTTLITSSTTESLVLNQDSSLHTSPPGLFNVPTSFESDLSSSSSISSNIPLKSNLTELHHPYSSQLPASLDSNEMYGSSLLWNKTLAHNINAIIATNSNNLAANTYNGSSSNGLYGTGVDSYDIFDHKSLIDLGFLGGHDFLASPIDSSRNQVHSMITSAYNSTSNTDLNSLSTELAHTSITYEASALLSGLSPNAPSFQPSSATNAYPLENHINNEIIHQNTFIDRTSNQNFIYQQENSMYNSEEFYESILLDSIVDGD